MPVVVTESALSVAANATSTDRYDGTDLAITPQDGVLRVASRASATGLNMTVVIGGAVMINDQVIPYTGAAGGISFRDNIVAEIEVPGGVKAQLRFRNTTGAAITVDAISKLEDM